jgi:hypothetical protein
MIWTAWVNRIGDRYPVELTNNDIPPAPHMRSGHQFAADTRLDAETVFKGLIEHGFPYEVTPKLPPGSVAPAKMWRYRGHNHYLTAQFRARGLSTQEVESRTKEAARCNELRNFNATVCGLHTEYQKLRMRSAGKISGFSEPDKAAAARTIQHIEEGVTTLQCIAGAAMAISDEASAAYELDPIERPFRIVAWPPTAVEVRSTEDAQKIESQNIEIAALKASIEELEATIRNFRTVQIDAIEPPCKESDPVLLTTTDEPPNNWGAAVVQQMVELEKAQIDNPQLNPAGAMNPKPPEPPKPTPPIPVKKHQNPNHPSNKTGAR